MSESTKKVTRKSTRKFSQEQTAYMQAKALFDACQEASREYSLLVDEEASRAFSALRDLARGPSHDS